MTRGIDTSEMEQALTRLFSHITTTYAGDRALIAADNNLRAAWVRVRSEIDTLMMLHEAAIVSNKMMREEIKDRDES